MGQTKAIMWEGKDMSCEQVPHQTFTQTHPKIFETFDNLLYLLMQEPSCSHQPPLPVSIDLEFTDDQSQQIRKIGISTLDI
jgi:hypothetical protein